MVQNITCSSLVNKHTYDYNGWLQIGRQVKKKITALLKLKADKQSGQRVFKNPIKS